MPKTLKTAEELGYSQEEWASFSRSKRWRLRNPGKQSLATKAWRDKNTQYNRDRQRKYQLKNQYGMTQYNYEIMLEQQGGKCAICETDKPTGKWKVFAVDHCHKTGVVRGLLCNECNRGIGLLRDDPELLSKAAQYLIAVKDKTAKERSGEIE